ncbi:hypothetical protein, partial [Xylella fastidiosa]|uniref:hypothetical protein n=1 Tax=Xylella fastidiosa TaxID=2371 RepID=UPI001EEBECED
FNSYTKFKTNLLHDWDKYDSTKEFLLKEDFYNDDGFVDSFCVDCGVADTSWDKKQDSWCCNWCNKIIEKN